MANIVPLASIIVPVYNGGGYISSCIETLLNQDYPKDMYEIIIVDNNSSDNTAEVVKRYPVRYAIETECQCSYAARNTGAKIARGDALVFFDADQTAPSDWLRNLLVNWTDCKYGAFVGKIIGVTCGNNIASKVWERDETTKDENVLIKICAGNAAIRHDVFNKVNGFDPAIFSMGDFDISLRIRNKLGLNIQYIPSAIIFHKEKSGWKSLLKREYRFGYGIYTLKSKHPKYCDSIITTLIKVCKRSLLGIGVIVKLCIAGKKMNKRREKLGVIVIDILMRWANLLGRVQCLLSNGKRLFPASW